jgi:hypothetical protein
LAWSGQALALAAAYPPAETPRGPRGLRKGVVKDLGSSTLRRKAIPGFVAGLGVRQREARVEVEGVEAALGDAHGRPRALHEPFLYINLPKIYTKLSRRELEQP